jgi:pimeloyl-ACP methyl ester carboxylesterase
MSSTSVLRISPVILRRIAAFVAGSGAGAYAYVNQVDTREYIKRVTDFGIAVRILGLKNFKSDQLRDMITGTIDPIRGLSLSDMVLLSEDPGFTEYIWSLSNRGTLVGIIRALSVDSTTPTSRAHLLRILSLAPACGDLISVVRDAHVDACSLGGSARGSADLKDLVSACKSGLDTNEIIPEWFLFFLLKNSESVSHLSSDGFGTIFESVVNVSLTDLGRTRHMFVSLVDAHVTRIATDVELCRLIVPILLRIIRLSNLPPSEVSNTISVIRRLLDRMDKEMDLESSSVMRRLAEQRRGVDSGLAGELLDLILSMQTSNPRMIIPSETQLEVIDEYFSQPSGVLQSILSKATVADTRSCQTQLTRSLHALEHAIGITDYESEQLQKAVDAVTQRRFDDAGELFAFHEEDNIQKIRRSDDIQSVVQRLGIIAELLRQRGNDSDRHLLTFITHVVFSRVAQLSSSVESVFVLRTLANIAILASFEEHKMRDQFIRMAKKFINQPNRDLSLHARAELRRLDHNVRCLPVKSVPVLIDSLLPITERTPLDSEIDIVFVHGLRGGLYSWRFEDINRVKDVTALWPEELLNPVFPEFRLLAFTFDAPLWYAVHKQHYTEVANVKRNFEEMAVSLRDTLEVAGSKRPGKKVVFVCFSMGGLVVKKALIDDPNLRKNTAGVVFFATPHLGSPIADFAYFAGSLVSPFVADLSTKSKHIVELHEEYKRTCSEIPTLAVCETAQSDLGAAGIKGMIVPFNSCAACGDRVVEAGDGIDHENVSKIKKDSGLNDSRMVELIKFLNTVTKDFN